MKKTPAQLDREIRGALSRTKPARKQRRAHATKLDAAPRITNRDEISSRTLAILGDELDDAAVRAARAGAVGDLEYQGAGMSGIVLCDKQGTAFKVARRGGEGTVAEEAEWLQKAGQVPGVRDHVARNARYDAENRVLLRECVQGETGTPRHTSKLFDLHKDIRKAMTPYGWLSPEFKEDSYVFARGRGPVLIDASHAAQLPGGAGDRSSGDPAMIPVLARAGIAVGADGVFLEVHDQPSEALSDGQNSLPLKDLEALLCKLKRIEEATCAA